jgi:predicted nuclease of predicted toxin-antitoxin system
VDECTGPAVSAWLVGLQHDAVSISQDQSGLSDIEVLRKSVVESRILITNDKDFGEMVIRGQEPHVGVILLRLEDERAASKVEVLGRLIEQYAGHLSGNFVIATEHSVRINRLN